MNYALLYNNMSDYAFQLSGLHKALSDGRMIQIPANQVFQASDYRASLTLLGSGYVTRYSITNSGNKSIQSIYGPGDVFPLTWAFHVLLQQEIYSGNEVFHYETLTNSVVYSLDDEGLKQLAARDPNIYKDLLYVAGQRFRSNIHNLENISLENTEKRLAHQLYFYARFHGLKTSRGVKILIPFKQKHLGSILDTTRETVSINVKALREKGLIKTGAFIIVPDLKKLETFAHS